MRVVPKIKTPLNVVGRLNIRLKISEVYITKGYKTVTTKNARERRSKKKKRGGIKGS